jgi:PAP2 superfamily
MYSRLLINDAAALRDFDKIIWRVIAIVAAIVFLSPIVSDFRIAWGAFVPALAAAAALTAGAWYYGAKRAEPRLSSALACTAQITIFAAVGAPLSYLAASVGAPLRDDALDAFDKALGFDWMALLGWLNAHPTTLTVLRAAYFSMTAQALIIVLCLAFTGRLIWLRVFVLSFMFAAIITIGISAVLPAQGVWSHYGLHATDPSAIVPATKTSWPIFEGLRDGSYRKLVAAGAEGIITFPSLHAALVVILTIAMWPIPGLRWVGLAINAVMLMATPIDGSHYLVDILAGIAVANFSVATSYAIAWNAATGSPLPVASSALVAGE